MPSGSYNWVGKTFHLSKWNKQDTNNKLTNCTYLVLPLPRLRQGLEWHPFLWSASGGEKIERKARCVAAAQKFMLKEKAPLPVIVGKRGFLLCGAAFISACRLG